MSLDTKPKPVEPVEPPSLALQLCEARRCAAHRGDTARATYGTSQYAFRRREWLKAVDAMNELQTKADEERESRRK